MTAIPGLIRVDPPCRHNPDLFFSEAPASIELAKAICRTCPWLRTCQLASLEGDERYGTWGALTADERQQLRPGSASEPTDYARGVA